MDKWAILIGINQYDHVKSLKYCENDVFDVKKAFCDLLEFPENHITLLSDDSETKPTRDKIFHHLGKICSEKKIQPDDLLIFYFSGHGMIGNRDGRDYLLPAGASPYALEQTGLKVEDVTDYLKMTGCNNLVMFMDACREAVEGTRGVMSIGEDSKAICKRSGIVTFFSCDPTDFSYEIDDLKHGSFTYNVLQALENPGCSTVEEIDKFLKDNVPLTNEHWKKPPQLPYCIIAPTDKNKLAIFINRKQWEEIKNDLDALAAKLGALSISGAVDNDLLNRCIDIVEQAKQGYRDERQKIIITRIEAFSCGNLTAPALKAILRAIEQQRIRQPKIQESEKLK